MREVELVVFIMAILLRQSSGASGLPTQGSPKLPKTPLLELLPTCCISYSYWPYCAVSRERGFGPQVGSP